MPIRKREATPDIDLRTLDKVLGGNVPVLPERFPRFSSTSLCRILKILNFVL